MKKIIFAVIGCAFISACAVAAIQDIKFSRDFIKNFKNCDKYSETATVEIEGKTYTEERNIAGISNGLCNYKVTVSDAENKYLYDCWFSDYQVEELYNAMRTRSKKGQQENIDIFTLVTDKKGRTNYRVAGKTTVSGTKSYVTWAKYRSNPYFCYPKKL